MPHATALPTELLAQVRTDAAGRTGTTAADWQVQKVVPVTWRDGGLGLPNAGFVTMALVPGFYVEVTNGDQILRYHTSNRYAGFAGDGAGAPGFGAFRTGPAADEIQ